MNAREIEALLNEILKELQECKERMNTIERTIGINRSEALLSENKTKVSS